MNVTITSIELHCRSIVRSLAFYEALLGAHLRRTGSGANECYVAQAQEGVTLRLRRAVRTRPAQPGTSFGFGLVAEEEALLRVLRTGASVLDGCVAVDPDGNHITVDVQVAPTDDGDVSDAVTVSPGE